jgi:hypothetical protein
MVNNTNIPNHSSDVIKEKLDREPGLATVREIGHRTYLPKLHVVFQQEICIRGRKR